MSFTFLCSLGSNIRPEYHVSRAKSYLTGVGSNIRYSRVITTEPVAMPSDQLFLNALLVLETHLDANKLKQAFNAIEVSLGRDRSDPLCKIKDRPIDLDILGEIPRASATNLTVSLAQWPASPDYLNALRGELFAAYYAVPAQPQESVNS